MTLSMTAYGCQHLALRMLTLFVLLTQGERSGCQLVREERAEKFLGALHGIYLNICGKKRLDIWVLPLLASK